MLLKFVSDPKVSVAFYMAAGEGSEQRVVPDELMKQRRVERCLLSGFKKETNTASVHVTGLH